jgi:murein tripeptide amidase MpaA
MNKFSNKNHKAKKTKSKFFVYTVLILISINTFFPAITSNSVNSIHPRKTNQELLDDAKNINIYPQESTIDINNGFNKISNLDLINEYITEANVINSRTQTLDLSWYENYKSLDNFYSKMNEFVSNYPNLAFKTTTGESIGGQPIEMLVITGQGYPFSKPVIIYLGCQHAREWISPMTVMYITENLLAQYETSPRIKNIMDKVTFFIVPMMNPDGYLYSWSGGRNWRKNRNTTFEPNCPGVDLNRNWDNHWGEVGADHNPCIDGTNNVYCGEATFSEYELQGVRDIALGFKDNIQVFIDFHSYSQLILSPWSYTNDPPPNSELFKELGDVIAEAIFSVHGEIYTFQSPYACSGVAKDWAFDKLDALSWTIELRPKSSEEGGFELPQDQIIPTVEENFEAMLTLAEAIMPPEMAWIDFSYSGEIQTGTYYQPYDSVLDGVSAIKNGGNIIIKPGSTNEKIVISKPMTLRSFKGVSVIGK